MGFHRSAFRRGSALRAAMEDGFDPSTHGFAMGCTTYLLRFAPEHDGSSAVSFVPVPKRAMTAEQTEDGAPAT